MILCKPGVAEDFEKWLVTGMHGKCMKCDPVAGGWGLQSQWDPGAEAYTEATNLLDFRGLKERQNLYT